MKATEQVYQTLLKLEHKLKRGVSALELGTIMDLDRTNASRYLNRLYEEKRVEKLEGRPVLYRVVQSSQPEVEIESKETVSSFDHLAAVQRSLHIPIQQAKAAILYPPRGLHTLVLGETGVGKSMFAELMHQFAVESGVVRADAPFVRFNCADYADNSQLLVSQIFGVKKGAYTGADRDRDGLLKKADGGFLFLDEVHRLSPQGQEMLFTFIDKGFFRPLGETERILSSHVRIIAATTEQPQSYLLNTFTRRIPMIIELPSLKARDSTERYHLIELFIKQESKRTGKSIYAEKNAVISFLLYECPNNIGQLKSDIQLSCAKAFVNYKSKKEDYIVITTNDLPAHVRKGMLRIQENRQQIDFLLKSKSPTIRFNYKEEGEYSNVHQPHINEDFYDFIEQKLETMRDKGMKDEEISYEINMDIETHFKKYLGDIPEKMHKQDITNVIQEDVLQVAEGILKLAGEKLQREYGEKIFIALALHLHGYIERAKKGVRIYHPKLNMIRIQHPDEFMTAMEAVKLIEKTFDVHTPLDEIGYLAMFLAPNLLEIEQAEQSKVGILILMHGNSTASSMAEVCNTMIGVDCAGALDMPLNMDPQLMYELTKEKVQQLNKGRGVMLLVDMGSLTGFGQMIQEETGIVVKTIDMASTPVILDACRKAALGRDIHYICDSTRGAVYLPHQDVHGEHQEKKNIIITACFTGEGASEKLKRVIEGQVQDDSIEIYPLNIINKKDFMTRIEQYREKHRILAIASTIDIKVDGIPFVPATDVLNGAALNKIRSLIEEEQNYCKIAQSLRTHIGAIDSEELVETIRRIIDAIELDLQAVIRNEVKVGMLLHMCFLVDKLKTGGQETHFSELTDYQAQYARELAIVRGRLRGIEKNYAIKIGSHEQAYICKMFTSNIEAEQAIV